MFLMLSACIIAFTHTYPLQPKVAFSGIRFGPAISGFRTLGSLLFPCFRVFGFSDAGCGAFVAGGLLLGGKGKVDIIQSNHIVRWVLISRQEVAE